MIKRIIEDKIKSKLFSGKLVLIFGPRQSGKTTLLRQILASYPEHGAYYNCDEREVRDLFSSQNSSVLRSVIGTKKLILIDEAQRIDNAGLNLKIIVDNIPDVQVIASGSSSFELSDKLNEPLTGRKWEYNLYPLAFQELAGNTEPMEEIKHLKLRLVYGAYPEVVTNPGNEQEILANLSSSYLYKDVFALHDLRRPELVEKLLRALAFQVSSEVSYHELAQLVDSDRSTVERYIGILERAFVLFRLPNFSSNLRNEIKRSRKIYFWDNGIRNALISDYRPVELRDDIGKLWENYIVSELFKKRDYLKLLAQPFFWRSKSSGDVDYLEVLNSVITAYELKWNPKKVARARAFQNAYPQAELKLINPGNYFQYLQEGY